MELKNDFGGEAKRTPSQDKVGMQRQLKDDINDLQQKRDSLFQEKAKRDV